LPVADVTLKLLASVFVDAASLRGADAFRRALAEHFLERDFYSLPVPDQPSGVDLGGLLSVLQSAKPDLQIAVSTRRFDYQIVGGNMPTDIASWDEFVSDAVVALEAVLRIAGRSGHRIAFVVEQLATNRVPRSAGPGDIARRLLTTPEQFEDEEWIWRVLMRRQDGDEVYNLFPKVSGIAGTYQNEPFNGIHIELDVNTVATKTEARFHADNLGLGFATLLSLTNDLSRQVGDFIGDY
jgi:hypothetical protein